MISGSHGKIMFGFVWNCQPAFQSGCTSFHSRQQGKGVPVAPHPCQQSLLSVFRILTILMTYLYWIFVLHIFSPRQRLVFHSFNKIFHRAEVLILTKSSLSIFSFIDHTFGVVSKTYHQPQLHLDFLQPSVFQEIYKCTPFIRWQNWDVKSN